MELSPNSLLLLNKFDSVNQLTSISLPPPPPALHPQKTQNKTKQKKQETIGLLMISWKMEVYQFVQKSNINRSEFGDNL